MKSRSACTASLTRMAKTCPSERSLATPAVYSTPWAASNALLVGFVRLVESATRLRVDGWASHRQSSPRVEVITVASPCSSRPTTGDASTCRLGLSCVGAPSTGRRPASSVYSEPSMEPT
jgi:hypothetical protein